MMDKDALAFLEKLVTTPSPSGYEQPGQKLMRERFKVIFKLDDNPRFLDP